MSTRLPMRFLRWLWSLFTRPLDPPEEHIAECPRCGAIVVVDCE